MLHVRLLSGMLMAIISSSGTFFVADKECANDGTSSYVPVCWKTIKVEIVLWGYSMT